MSPPAPEAPEPSARERLAATIGVTGFFTLAFGAIVGSGWVLTLGEWLTRAAPGGTLIGLMAGGAIIMTIGACYAELGTRLPRAGGEILYVLQSFGPYPAFVVGWFIALNAIATCAFEGIALGWFFATLFPSVHLNLPWIAFGPTFDAQSWLIGSIGALAVGALHYRGSRGAIRFQNIVTLSFLAVMAGVIVVGTTAGSVGNLSPLLERPDGSSAISGSLWVFATSGFFLNGFQTAVHALEERKATVSARTAVNAMLLAIAAAALFYGTLVIATGLAAPWQDTVKASLPAVAAFGHLRFGTVLSAITLTAATTSLLKTWTAVALMGSRILFSQARMGFLPPVFCRVHPKWGAPTTAIVFVTACTLVGICFGRGFVGAIVSMSAICMSISFVICIACLLRQRKHAGPKPSFQVPGGRVTISVALGGATLMAGVAFLDPLIRGHGGIPPQWWLMFLWSLLGALGWTLSRRLALTRTTEASTGL